ncbi:hypothetical protein KZY54_04425 [Prevotella nanceiensis]|uniref:hypothetical protein n=1 Tax=Hoylesella nanceiensis TaxID=425941 RepID=UPI001C5E1854|nr:hypothetical protein [Hoylesella nanceiensis]MBW4834472.1 hypothetical protein [Hoylesella nanceiensis]
MKQILITSIKAVLLQDNSNVIAPQKLWYYLPKAVSLVDMSYDFELQRLLNDDEVSKKGDGTKKPRHSSRTTRLPSKNIIINTINFYILMN